MTSCFDGSFVNFNVSDICPINQMFVRFRVLGAVISAVAADRFRDGATEEDCSEVDILSYYECLRNE